MRTLPTTVALALALTIPLLAAAAEGKGNRAAAGPPAEMAIVKRFDSDGNQRLDQQERATARAFLNQERQRRPGPPRPSGSEARLAPAPGPRVARGSVALHPYAALYDGSVVRTLFLDFEDAGWESELAAFHRTDVELPAALTVDGRTYPGVGVRFRGMSSFMMVPDGGKRSLKLSLDFTDQAQRLRGQRTLNLLNAHEDPTYLRSVLYLTIARDYLPAPKANHVHVVINGESRGVFVNVQPFSKEFLREWFGEDGGQRWKAPGHPGGDAGLRYLGPDIAAYRRHYQLKSKEDPAAWAALIELTRVLCETPLDRLEAALAPILDIDGTLRFLAVDNVLVNNDGYWVRASDYNLYRDQAGRFHLIPHDVNETFRAPGGPGFRPGPDGGDAPTARGVDLDPLAGSDDARKPLLSRLLQVPALRQRYLGHVRKVAREALDWGRLGPLARKQQAQIAGPVAGDTRKLASLEAFEKNLEEDVKESDPRGRPHTLIGLRRFVEHRRAFLLTHPALNPTASLVDTMGARADRP